MSGFRLQPIKLLSPEGHVARLAFWGVVLLVMIAVALAVLFGPVRPTAQADAQQYLATLPLDEVLAPTPTERREAGELRFLRDPLAPAAPPAQAITRPSGSLFGIRDDRRAAFVRATTALRDAQAGCRGRPAAPPPGFSAAGDNLTAASDGATLERAIFSYHQGVIELCIGSGHAAEQFQIALTALDRDKPAPDCVGHPTSAPNCRLWLQYRVAALYGAGLAEMAANAPANTVSVRFRDALAAAEGAEPRHDVGPFVALHGAERELFDFSTADILTAQLYLYLSRGQPREAWRAVEGRRLTAQDLADHPGLAVNWASAAAAMGQTRSLGQLLLAVRGRIQAGAGGEWQTPGSPALARLAALAAMSSDRIFVQGDQAWWPQGQTPSRVRAAFEQRHGPAGEEWFPPIALEPSDAEAIDQWLWIRRQRGQIRDHAFAQFHDEAPNLNGLDPRPKRTLTAWRREVMHTLGGRLYEQAETVLNDRGPVQAAPLFQILAGPEYGFWVNLRARMVLLTHHSAIWGLVGAGLIVGLAALLAYLHFAFAAGYRRTFTHRHYDQRIARQAGG